MVEILAVTVHTDEPYLSAAITFVPGGSSIGYINEILNIFLTWEQLECWEPHFQSQRRQEGSSLRFPDRHCGIDYLSEDHGLQLTLWIRSLSTVEGLRQL